MLRDERVKIATAFGQIALEPEKEAECLGFGKGLKRFFRRPAEEVVGEAVDGFERIEVRYRQMIGLISNFGCWES